MEFDCDRYGYKKGTFLNDVDVLRLEGENRCCALKRLSGSSIRQTKRGKGKFKRVKEK